MRGTYSLGADSTRVQPSYAFQMIRPEQLWKFVASHDYYAGDFMWTGIDYLGETQWQSKGASSGPIDMAGFRKDAFYFYQSQWTTQPVLHLMPHWNWPGREGQLIPVIAYTNVETRLCSRTQNVTASPRKISDATTCWTTKEDSNVASVCTRKSP